MLIATKYCISLMNDNEDELASSDRHNNDERNTIRLKMRYLSQTVLLHKPQDLCSRISCQI